MRASASRRAASRLEPARRGASGAPRRRRADLPLPLRRAHAGECRRGSPARAVAKPTFSTAGSMPGRRQDSRSHSTASSRSRLMRQVQIAAGILVLAGVVLGWLVAPAFYLLSAFVGAGLDVGRRHRLLRHGAAARPDAVEQARERSRVLTTGFISTVGHLDARHAGSFVGRFGQPGRAYRSD